MESIFQNDEREQSENRSRPNYSVSELVMFFISSSTTDFSKSEVEMPQCIALLSLAY